MNLSSIEVWERIAASRLADAKQCRGWAAEAAKSLSASQAADGQQVLRQLVRLRYLTEHQAKIVAGLTGGPLRIDDRLVRRVLVDPIWRDWYEVQASGAAGDGEQASELRWTRPLSAESLEQLRVCAPSMKFVKEQASVRGRHLQRVFEPTLAEGRLLLHVEPVIGTTLAEQFRSQSPDANTAQTIVHHVGMALSNMHQAQLAHGCLRPDRIYWDGQRTVLVRDPLCRYATGLRQHSDGLLGSLMDAVGAAHYLAPEFLAPGQHPTLASDVFGLGCLWWWLLTGKHACPGKTAQEILAHSAAQSPELPSSVSLPQPIERVLRAALAKRPAHRFASATEFFHAMQAAKQLARKTADPQSGPVTHSQTRADQAKSHEQMSTSKTLKSEAAASDATATTTQTKDEQQSTGGLTGRRSRSNGPQQSTAPASQLAHAAAATAIPGDGNKLHVSRTQRTKPAQTKLQPGASRAPTARKSRRKRGIEKWLLPMTAGCSLLILVLLALHFSGALRTEPAKKTADKPPPFVPDHPLAEMPLPDPLLDHYVLVDSNERALWAPPALADPLDFGMLPPGSQCFVSLRPSNLAGIGPLAKLVSSSVLIDEDFVSVFNSRAGVAFEEMLQCTFAFYSATSNSATPQTAIRVELRQDRTLSGLLAAWGNPEPTDEPGPSLFVAGNWAYFVPDLASEAESESASERVVSSFSLGPRDLMREVVDLQGTEGPLLAELGRLRKASDSQADLVILLSPHYLFSEGRGLVKLMPDKLRQHLPDLIGRDTRAALLQTRLTPDWYIELQLVGQSDRDSARLVAELESRLSELPRLVEQWLVDQSPHPHWRALALRFPQMLRSLNDYTRFGVENGVAALNAYLPPQAAPNLLLASWIALQDNATLGGESAATAQAIVPQALSVEEYLARAVRVSFSQEPIEKALQLVGEEANSGLPPGNASWRFELDGAAFENAGITRNQQLENFSHEDSPVRDALTDIARRGNPVTTVTDSRDEDQQLIWVVREDPHAPGRSMVSLTTRVAAQAAGISLPVEFAP